MIPFWKRWLSYVVPFVLEKAKGEIHDELRLILTRGHLEVEGEDANYSYGTNHYAWRNVLRDMEVLWEKATHYLILGFGCGTIASLIDHPECHVVGIEKEPVLLKWFYRYFQDLLRGTYEIIQMDVNEFVPEGNQKYDAILIDLFIGTQIPKEFLSLSFVEKWKAYLSYEGVIVMNFLETYQEQSGFARKLNQEIGGMLLSYYPNLFWVYRKQETNANFVP